MKRRKSTFQLFAVLLGSVAIAAYFFLSSDSVDSSVPAEGLPAPVVKKAKKTKKPQPAQAETPDASTDKIVAEAPSLIAPIVDIAPPIIQEEPPFPKAPDNPWLNQNLENLVYAFPTDNKGLLEEDNEKFFMYCDRFFEGEASMPWQAGQFGFVRTPFRLSSGEVMYSKLHEGIDIGPLERDAKGDAVDLIRAVAPGKVVHASSAPGASNYGRYVVVSHDLPEGTFFSLYAHMQDVRVEEGQEVDNSVVLGRMGYSGDGLNQRRAHLHLEFCFMISSHYAACTPKGNVHGNHNGLNLIGMNMVDILRAGKGEKPISISDYLNTLEELYRIRIPNTPELDFIARYPFLLRCTPEERAKAASLDIAFTAEGIPLAAYPCDEKVTAPKVLSSKPQPTLLQNCTSNRLKNNSQNPQLTANGQRFIQLFTQRPK